MNTRICSKCGIEKPETKDYFQFRYSRGYFMRHCLECKRAKAREYINRPDIKKKRDKYTKDNWDKTRKYQHEYYLANKKLIVNRAVKNRRQRRKEDPNLRLRDSVSALIRHSLKYQKNGWSWENLVGYTQEELRSHLERQFKPGMTWENHGKGGWNIDHKIPISLFNIDGPKSKGFKKCWALENLQPMWESDNIRKSNKIFS